MYEKPVTLKDVAEKSDYSLRTVKKVLAGDTTVRPQTRENVMKVARELGYRKNMVASALATNKVWNIAVVTGDYRYFFPEAIEGFKKEQRSWRNLKVGIEFLVADRKTKDAAGKLLRTILENDRFDAVIMHASSMEGLNKEINALVEAGKVVCTFGADAPGSKRLFFVGPRAYESGRIAAQITANYTGGKGSVYVISQVQDEMQTLERYRGFRDFTEEKYPGIEVNQILIRGGAEQYYSRVNSLLQDRDVTGIVGLDADCYIIGNAAKDCGRKDIFTLGFDLMPETERLLEEEYFKVILSQDPQGQAVVVLNALCKYLLYGMKAKNIFTDVAIVTSEVLRYRNNLKE